MATKTMPLAEAEAAYREAWEADRRETELRLVRARVPSLERRVEQHKARIVELETHLDELLKLRDAFAKELEGLPKDTRDLPAQEEDAIRGRRKDLRDAIAALDGAEAMGTLVDHLWNQSRIPRTKRQITEEQDLMAATDAELAEARRQLEA